MTPYVLKFIPSEDIALFEKIRLAIQQLPDLNLGVDESGKEIILSCHVLARATSKVFGLRYVDGCFERSWDHSWLVTGQNNIIDVYPIATHGGPLLIDGNSGSPARILYQRTSAKKLSRGRFGHTSFRRSIERVRRELSKIA